jgi:CxxC motif-containing protein
LNSLEVEAPQKRGDIMVKNLLGEGVDLVVTRTIERRE